MNKALSRTRLMGILALGGLTIALWQFVLAPRAAEPGLISDQVTAAEAEKDQLQAEYQQLLEKSKNIATAEKDANLLNQLLPSTSAEPELTQAINDAAIAAGMDPSQITYVTTTSLALIDPGVMEASIKAMKVRTGETPAATTDATSEATPAAEGEAPAEAPVAEGEVTEDAGQKPAALQVYSMNVSIQVTGTMQQIVAFTKNLSNVNRTLTIDHISVTPDDSGVGGVSNGNYRATVDARAFTVEAIGAAPGSSSKKNSDTKSATSTPAATPGATPSTTTPNTSATPTPNATTTTPATQ